MKHILHIGLAVLLFSAFVSIANDTFFSSATAASLETSELYADNTRATLSNDLKIDYQKQDTTDLPADLQNHWGKLAISLLAVFEIVVRLTPSEKDNTVLSYLSKIINAFIPNRKKGGGTF